MSDEQTPEAGVETPFKPSMILDETQQARLSSFLTAEIDAVEAGRDKDKLLSDWNTWRRHRLARPEQETRSYPWASSANLAAPAVANKVNTATAKMYATFAIKDPFWKVETDDLMLKAKTRSLEKYLNFLARTPQNLALHEKTWGIFYEECSMGTAFVKIPWLYEETKFRSGDTGSEEEIVQILHNGPAVIPLQIEDVYTRAHWSDLQRAPWVGVRHVLTYSELKAREALGIYSNVDSVLPNFISAEIDLKETAQKTLGIEANYSSQDMETAEYEIFEVYVKWSLKEGDTPIDIRVFFAKEAGVFLRAEYNSLGRRDILPFRYVEIPGQLYGVGICYQGQYLQEEIDTLHNMRTDSIHQTAFPAWKSKRGILGPKEEIHPNKIIQVDDPDDIQPFVTPDTSGSTYQAELLAGDYLSRITGVNEIMSGYSDPTLKSGGGAEANLMLAQQGSSVMNAVQSGTQHTMAALGQLVFYQLVANKELVSLDMLEEEDRANVQDLLNIPLADVPSKLYFSVKVTDVDSTKQAQNQRTLAAAQMYQQYVQGSMQLAAMAENPQAPAMARKIALNGLYGATKFMLQALEAFDITDAAEYVPSFEMIGAALDAQDQQDALMAKEARNAATQETNGSFGGGGEMGALGGNLGQPSIPMGGAPGNMGGLPGGAGGSIPGGQPGALGPQGF